jgi:hypothetical protein
MNTNQVPYAFPIPEKLAATDVQHGMTIRDLFRGEGYAGARALQRISCPERN